MKINDLSSTGYAIFAGVFFTLFGVCSFFGNDLMAVMSLSMGVIYFLAGLHLVVHHEKEET